MGRAAVLLCLLGLAAAARATDPGGACARYGPPRRVGTVPAALYELSGLAASRRHAGVFWAHNDSGHAAALHAMREDGRVVATFPLRGVRVRDPEDIAVGPCAPTGPATCVYLADTGDNLARRSEARVLRVAEPAALDGRPLAADLLPFTYPDGAHNTEALVVEPGTARLFVVTKAFTSLGEVYRLDGLRPGGRGRAVRVGAIATPAARDALVTGADAHPAGGRVLLRTYAGVWELSRPGAQRLEEVFAARPVAVPSAPSPQAEAAAYLADGRGYLLGSEREGSPLVRVDCAPE